MLSDIGTEAENEDLAISEPKDAANVQTEQKDQNEELPEQSTKKAKKQIAKPKSTPDEKSLSQ